MGILVKGAGHPLAVAITDLYPLITQDWVGVNLATASDDYISSNPVAVFTTQFDLTFISGESITAVGLIDFVAAFVNAVASGETLLNPLEDLFRQLPNLGLYNPWYFEVVGTIHSELYNNLEIYDNWELTE